MAEIVSEQYRSVFTIPRQNIKYAFTKTYTFDSVLDIDITEDSIKDAVNEMKTSSAAGPDGISSFFYKEYIEQLWYPIKKIWRMSLDEGKLPEGDAMAIGYNNTNILIRIVIVLQLGLTAKVLSI